VKKWVVGAAVVAGVVFGWLAAGDAARAYAGRQTRELIGRLVEDKPGEREEVRRALWGVGLGAAPVAADVLRRGGLRERRAALVACETVVESCLMNFETMNCVTGFVPGRGEAERAFDTVGAALEGAFGDADAGVRREAARIVLAGPDRPADRRARAAEVFREALRDPDPAARRDVVDSLCRSGRYGGLPRDGAEALPVLGEVVVKDPDAAVRGAAVEALGRGQEAGAAGPLVAALADGDVSVRRAAKWVLLSGHYLNEEVVDPRTRVTPEARAAFRPGVPVFAGWLTRDDPEAELVDREQCRRKAVVGLFRAGGPGAVGPLAEALRGPRQAGDGDFRRAVVTVLELLAADADCLAALGGYQAELRGALVDPRDREVRSLSASILRRTRPGTDGAVAELVARSARPDPKVRAVAVEALGLFVPTSEEARRALRRAEEGDVDAGVREAARRAREDWIFIFEKKYWWLG